MAIKRGVSLREADNIRVYDNLGHAFQVLGLSLAEGYRLFLLMEWPVEFKSLMDEEDNTLEGLQARAVIAAARIDHFIVTNGRE